MKKTALVALTLATLLSSVLYAQRSSAPQLSKAAIDVHGTKLRLGMSKGEVTDKLTGNEITKDDEDNWNIASSGNLGPTLQFTDGRLSYADRYWTTYDNDIAEALFGAVNSLNQEGFSACTVTADTKTEPDTTAHRVWIRCGEKSILLVRDSIGEKSHNMVYEQLGAMR
jgi:hypothetical protein